MSQTKNTDIWRTSNARVFEKNGVALSAIKTPERQIWRARLTAGALEHAGFNDPTNDQFQVIQGLLRLQGIPERFLGEGNPLRAEIEKKTGALLIEFNDP